MDPIRLSFLKKSNKLSSNYYISHFCKLDSSSIWIDGELELNAPKTNFTDFSKLAYQRFDLQYPKFFKMDKLSKLAFLSAELILEKVIKKDQENNIALVFSNQSASLDTDVNYQDTISNRNEYYPSPSVFVYTLPNICIGEISIKHRLQTENIFFVTDVFDTELMFSYAEAILNKGKAEQVLCGWVELYQENYHSFVYLVGKEGKEEHTIQNINNLHNK